MSWQTFQEIIQVALAVVGGGTGLWAGARYIINLLSSSKEAEASITRESMGYVYNMIDGLREDNRQMRKQIQALRERKDEVEERCEQQAKEWSARYDALAEKYDETDRLSQERADEISRLQKSCDAFRARANELQAYSEKLRRRQSN